MNASLVPILARQSCSRLNVLRLQFFRTFSVVFNCRSLFNEAAYLTRAALLRLSGFVRHLQSMMPTRNNQRQKYMKKTHLLLRISAVIGRYRPHLMIVMIFVTQNNRFKTVQEFSSDRLLGFYQIGLCRELQPFKVQHNLQEASA